MRAKFSGFYRGKEQSERENGSKTDQQETEKMDSNILYPGCARTGVCLFCCLVLSEQQGEMAGGIYFI